MVVPFPVAPVGSLGSLADDETAHRVSLSCEFDAAMEGGRT